jgi:hypothetical protein
MSDLPELPEATGLRYWTVGNSARWQYAALGSKHAPPTAEPLFTAAQMHDYGKACLASAQQRIEELERDALKYRALHTPEIVDFIAAVEREALFQREKWGADGDAGKTDADWFWLLGYLGGKAIRSDATQEKRLHHIITTAAACLNWHAARVGAYTDMRPGTERPDELAPSKAYLSGISPQSAWPFAQDDKGTAG